MSAPRLTRVERPRCSTPTLRHDRAGHAPSGRRVEPAVAHDGVVQGGRSEPCPDEARARDGRTREARTCQACRVEGGARTLDLGLAPDLVHDLCSAVHPLAVASPFQKRGIGTALVQDSLKRLADKHYDLVLVLGEPNYYSRFGFTPRLAERLKTPYDGPYLQALALSDKGKDAYGPVSYAQAFVELE